MTRTVPLALALSLVFGPALSAQQASHASIRASIELEAARLASSLAAADAARDQSAVSVEAGKSTKERLNERVRITSSDRRERIVGWIDRIDEQTLTIIPQKGAAVTMPLNTIARIERTNGKRSRFGAAVLGLIVGAVGGNRLASLGTGDCHQAYQVARANAPIGSWAGAFDGIGCAIDNSIGMVMGTVEGGVVGTVVGAFLPNQKWMTVPTSSLVSVFPTP